MANIERTVDIEAPAAVVWDLLVQTRRLPEFSRSTVSVSDAPERLRGLHDRFRQQVKAVGRAFDSQWEVVDWEVGRMLAVEGSVGFGVRQCVRERVDAVGEQRCRLSVCVTYTLPFGPLGRVAGRLGVARLAEAEAGEVVAGLQRAAEAIASATA